MEEQYPLGRVEIPDERDLQYLMSDLIPEASPRPWRYWRAGPILNQGAKACPDCATGNHPYCCQLGYCVEFAWLQWMQTSPTRHNVQPPFLHIYHRAQQLDPWEGTNYAGTSVRAGAKVLQELGFIDEYRWAWSLDELVTWVLEKGPVIVGSIWTNGMFYPDSKGFIHPTGNIVGGHAYEINGVNQTQEKARIINSWGNWGQNGRAWVSFDDLEYLLSQGGEACTAIEKVT